MIYTQHIETPDGNFWNGLTAVATFSAVIVALFGEHFWSWRRRPILNVSFDRRSDRCFRKAVNPEDIFQDQEDAKFTNIEKQYFRLRVCNSGRTSVRQLKAKIELYDIDKRELADRFEPNKLIWIDGSETIELAPNEEDYVNCISQVIKHDNHPIYSEGIKYKLRMEISRAHIRGIAWDRSVKNYILKITFHADNFPKPVTKFFKFTPSKDGGAGNLKVVRGWRF